MQRTRRIFKSANLIASLEFLMRWLSNPVDNCKTQSLTAAVADFKLNVPPRVLPVLADLLVRRGIDDAGGCRALSFALARAPARPAADGLG